VNAFDAFKMYSAIKLHFTNKNYDYFKYHGGIRADASKFEVRKDKYFFGKLAKIDNLQIYLAVNFFEDKKLWVGKLLDNECRVRYEQTEKHLQALTYNFKNEMSQFESLDEALNISNGNYPKIFNEYKKGNVSKETIIIINNILNVYPYWDGHINDTVVWPMYREKFLKYKNFFTYDKQKFLDILVDFQ
jgi:hypothetical protein